MPERETLANFAASGATLAIHLSIHVLDKVVAELTPQYGSDCPVAVVYRASWPDERVIRATLQTIVECVAAAAPIERTALILVGPVLAARDFRETALYDPDYRRRFRPERARAEGAWRERDDPVGMERPGAEFLGTGNPGAGRSGIDREETDRRGTEQ
jgi:precorrin-4/cobalt-precorrin-4 C11-methyltransferase